MGENKIDIERRYIKSLDDELLLWKILTKMQADLESIKNVQQRQMEDKEQWIRKLIYLIVGILSTLAGASGIFRAILGGI